MIESLTKKIKNKTQQIKEVHSERQQINNLIYQWKQIMAESGVKNNSFSTLTLMNIKIETYGFSAEVISPYGLNFNSLETLKPSIEHTIGCVFNYKYKRMKQYVDCKFITKTIDEVDFKSCKTKPWELFLGIGIDGESIIVDMLKFPHLINTGATGMGKTKLIDTIITNAICNSTPEQLGLFLIQTDKCDQAVYRRCKHTRAYADTVEKALAVTNYLLKLVEYRNKQLESFIDDGSANNIFDYNKHNPNKKWKYYYLVIDEYSSLMPDECSDSKGIKDIKKNIQGNMERISQLSRSTGLYIIVGLQRSTVNKMPSFLKAMMNVNVAFRAVNTRSSQVAIDCDEAVFLDVREAIVKINDMQYMKTVTLTNKMIVEWIDEYRIPKKLYKDCFDYKSFLPKEKDSDEKNDKDNKNKNKSKQKQKKNNNDNDSTEYITNHFDKVDPNTILKKEEQYKDNIKNIPNFVPYCKAKITKAVENPVNAPLIINIKKKGNDNI